MAAHGTWTVSKIAELASLQAALRAEKSERLIPLLHLVAKEYVEGCVTNAAGFFDARHNFVSHIRNPVLKRLRECFNKCAQGQSHRKAARGAKFATKQNGTERQGKETPDTTPRKSREPRGAHKRELTY